MKPSRLVLFLKRFTDLAGGVAGFILFVVTFPIIAMLIRLESPGPVLYRQVRVGMNRRGRRPQSHAGYSGPERRGRDWGGRPFSIVKYRTMRVDAEAAGPQLCVNGGADPRITRLGRWLRALHIDEIPQFINVVKGDMSLIGPRPERPHFTEKYGVALPHYSDRTHAIRPGITGLAQILLGYDESSESVVRKSHYDMSYRASFCSAASWIRMELWIYVHTLLYLLHKPNLEGETRDLDGLKRAKQLPFQGRSSGAHRNIQVSVSFGKEAPTHMLASVDPAELCERLENIDFSGKQAPVVYVRPKENLDLADLGLLLRLAHQVKSRGGELYLRSANPKTRKMLREIKLDSILDVHHATAPVRNFLTVDVECWFHAYNMRRVAPKCTWHALPTRVERNMERILELLRLHNVKATFFVLGWVADHHPEAVRMIAQEGHEIGTHGYHHDLLTEMTPMQFEDDLLRSLEAIGRHTSRPVRGHRASNFTLVKSTLWALEILARHGIEYDSSVFPIGRDRYGMPDYPNRLPHIIRLPDGRTLKEFPMSTSKVGKHLLPICGGGYFRLYPHRVTERFIAQANVRGLPAMVYLHPWEFDTEQEKHYLGLAKTFQHYVNLDSTYWKLNRLLQRFDFASISGAMELPRVQSLLRRRPVDAALLHSEGYVTPRMPAYAASTLAAERLDKMRAEAIAAAEAADLATVAEAARAAGAGAKPAPLPAPEEMVGELKLG
jgi:polysaccharide deacetylase family protein (PEP-CTERM system associated)